MSHTYKQESFYRKRKEVSQGRRKGVLDWLAEEMRKPGVGPPVPKCGWARPYFLPSVSCFCKGTASSPEGVLLCYRETQPHWQRA